MTKSSASCSMILATTIAALQPNAIFSSSEAPPFPTNRYKSWNDLDWMTRNDARYLLYIPETWNTFLAGPLERMTYDQVAEFLGLNDANYINRWQRTNNALQQVAIDSRTWDCWINHYIGNSWEDLESKHDVSWAFQALGWNSSNWKNDDPGSWPETENKRYLDLTGEEKLAAERICCPAEIWDGFPLDEWEYNEDGVSTAQLNFEAKYPPPTNDPSRSPSNPPTAFPTTSPVATISEAAQEYKLAVISNAPSVYVPPTDNPTETPTESPSGSPSSTPTIHPSATPSFSPTTSPSVRPSRSSFPSASPSDSPSSSKVSSNSPTFAPTKIPTATPSESPTRVRSAIPTSSSAPSSRPTENPSSSPSTSPSGTPSLRPTNIPSMSPTITHSITPSASIAPSAFPTISPSSTPSSSPTVAPTVWVCRANFTLSILTDKYPKETSWSLTMEPTNKIVDERTGYENDFETHVDTMCIQYDTCYMFQINDMWDDGMCCENGQGSYAGFITYTNRPEGLLPIPGLNGGAFEAQQKHRFCLDKNGDLVEGQGLGPAIGTRFNGRYGGI